MRRLIFVMLPSILVAWLALPALADIPTSPPEAPTVSEDEEAKLLDGKLIIHMDVDGDEGKVLGIIEIDASMDRVWEEILDLDARAAENKPVEDMEVYHDEASGDWRHIKARWDLRVFGQDITWYNHYRYNASTSYFWFSLDPDHDSDIVKADGYYHVFPSPLVEGGSRFIYLADTDTGRKMPGTLKDFLAKHGLKDMLKAIKKRAED